jgi:hypothetical protein
LEGEGNYALTSVKEIDGTEAFLALDDDIKLCQNKELLADCSSREFDDNKTGSVQVCTI